MSIATILLAPSNRMHEFFCNQNAVELALQLYAAGEYSVVAHIQTDIEPGEAVAEDMFNLTNDPLRQDDRAELYGPHRSMCTGDIVQVGDDMFLCQAMGWVKL